MLTFEALPTIALFATGGWTDDLSDAAIGEIMSVFGADFDDFMSLHMFHRPTGLTKSEFVFMHKYVLYSDVLQGAFDSNIPDGLSKFFGEVCVRMKENAVLYLDADSAKLL